MAMNEEKMNSDYIQAVRSNEKYIVLNKQTAEPMSAIYSKESDVIDEKNRLVEFDHMVKGMTRGEAILVKDQMLDRKHHFGRNFSPEQNEKFKGNMQVLDKNIAEKEMQIMGKLQKHFEKKYETKVYPLGVKGEGFHFELKDDPDTHFRVQPFGKFKSDYQVQVHSKTNKDWNTMFKINQKDIEPTKHEKVISFQMDR